MAPVVLAVPLLAENRVGRTTPVALVVLLLKEDLDLTAGHMVRVGHMVAHPSRKGDPDRTANQISTTRANQISTTSRGSAGRRGLLRLRWLSGQSRCAVAFL